MGAPNLANSVDKAETAALLRSLVRDVARSQLSGFCQNEGVEVLELGNRPEFNKEHMSVTIFVSTNVLNVNFKIHFTEATAFTIAGRGLKLQPPKLSLIVACDYIAEFCNLTAGMIRRALQLSEVIEGDLTPFMPVPKKVLSFNAPSKKDICDSWELVALGCHFVCALETTVFDWERLKRLGVKNPNEMLAADEGEILFL